MDKIYAKQNLLKRALFLKIQLREADIEINKSEKHLKTYNCMKGFTDFTFYLYLYGKKKLDGLFY